MNPPIEAVMKRCEGEAHQNPMIDHCMVCVPYWGEYPSCPYHGGKLVSPNKDAKKIMCRRGLNPHFVYMPKVQR